MRLPIDILEGGYQEIGFDVEQYQLLMTHHLKEAYEIVKQEIETKAHETKVYWDNKINRQPSKFNIGDKVLFYHPRINSESEDENRKHTLSRKWLRPLTVINQPTDPYIRCMIQRLKENGL